MARSNQKTSLTLTFSLRKYSTIILLSSFSNADRLKFVASMHIDVSMYPLEYLRSKGIAVSNAKGYCTEAVAELAIAAMLDVMRRTHETMKQVERGDWPFAKLRSRELKGKTIGIIGCGNIGRRVAEIARLRNARRISFWNGKDNGTRRIT